MEDTVFDVGLFVRLCYNINVKFMKKVTSYDDEIYILTTDMEKTYLLKAITMKDDEEIRTQEAIGDVMTRLANAGFSVPVWIKKKDGSTSTLYPIGKSKPSFLVLQSFLQGSVLDDIICSQKEMIDLIFKCGQKLAAIACHFKGEDFSHLSRPKSEWNLLQVDIYRPYLAELSDQIREHCQNAIHTFETMVVPKLFSFQAGFIHADGNACNFIISPNGSGWKLTGVIDFGDCCMSHYVVDAGTFIADMMEKAQSSNFDIHEAAKHAYQGYINVLPLNRDEIEVLDLVVAARFAQNISIGTHLMNLKPEKCDLVMQTVKPCSEILTTLSSVSRKQIHELWTIS